MGLPYPNIKPQFNDVNGVPLSGGMLYIYAAGTSTPATSYSDSALTTANTNPIILDSRGECNCFLADGNYKFILHDADDVEVWSEDNIAIEDFSSGSTLLDKYTISYADIAAAALTDTETILSLASKTVIEYIVVKHTTLFSGGSISALTMDIGDGTDADELLAAYDLTAVVADTAWESVSTVYIGSFASATNIIATFTAVGDNLDQLTQGSVDIYVKTKGMN